MNVFIGENGTGKTLVSYAIFSFIYWFNNNFIVEDIVNEEDIKNVLHRRKISIPIKTAKEKIIDQAVEKFNSFEFEFFDSFFNHTGVYTKSSEIKITHDDVEALLIDSQYITSWFTPWNIRKNSDFSSNFAEHTETISGNINKLVCSLNGNNIDIMYYPPKNITQDDFQDQFDELKNSDEKFKIINLSIQNVLFKSFPFMRPVYLPAERIGINVFRSDLNLTRLNSFSSESLLSNRQNQSEPKKYAFPIENYIAFVNNNVEKLNKKIDAVDENNLINQLVPGNFSYDKEDDSVRYGLPSATMTKMDFEVISSSLKSIFGLDFFIKSDPRGRWLFFDEPEMNLHPEKQKIIANLTYGLMKKGIHLVVSTHSDYYVKQIINCVLKDKLNGQENNEISVYEFKNGTAIKINDIFKIDESVNNFDDTTREINDEYYEIIDKLEDREV